MRFVFCMCVEVRVGFRAGYFWSYVRSVQLCLRARVHEINTNSYHHSVCPLFEVRAVLVLCVTVGCFLVLCVVNSSVLVCALLCWNQKNIITIGFVRCDVCVFCFACVLRLE